jgi:hypothetical protein
MTLDKEEKVKDSGTEEPSVKKVEEPSELEASTGKDTLGMSFAGKPKGGKKTKPKAAPKAPSGMVRVKRDLHKPHLSQWDFKWFDHSRSHIWQDLLNGEAVSVPAKVATALGDFVHEV